MILLLIVLLLIFFAINIPIGIAIGLSTVIVVILTDDIDLIRLAQEMFGSMNSFPLLAAPFFILAGKLMEHGGISQKLIDLANSLVGNVRGGLGYVSILACMFFAAISGSTIATILAIGGIMIPAMVKAGYDRNFASSVQAAAGVTGGIIPPSIPLVLYGVTAGVSIGDLFLAGIVPGIGIGLSLMIVAFFFSPKIVNDIEERIPIQTRLKEMLVSIKDAIWAILMPVIILGGIYGGIFTPTEAAVVAVVYGLIIGVFVYKKINFTVMKKILHSTVLTTATIGFIIAAASFFGMWLTLERVPYSIAEAFQSSGFTPFFTMILITLFLLLLGCFMDATAALVITTPILFPIAVDMGFDPVHFGIIMIVNLSIGYLTPPLGVGLFVAAKVGETRFESLIKPVLPFLLILIVDVLLIILLPQISSGVAESLAS